MNRRRWTILAFVAVFVMAWPTLWDQTRFGNIYDDRPFDQKIWLASPFPDTDDYVRARMADDLAENHLKPGMTVKEVTNLLGVAEEIEREDEAPGSEITYNIGNRSDLYNDLGYFVILFDAKGRLEIAGVYRS